MTWRASGPRNITQSDAFRFGIGIGQHGQTILGGSLADWWFDMLEEYMVVPEAYRAWLMP
jgi:hypothetical protein